MKKVLGIMFSFLLVGASFGQADKAKEILDKVSAKTKAYKTISLSFDLTISGADSNPIKQQGKAFLSGDKYKVELADQEIYCDGTTITTYLKDDAECYTSAVSDSEDEGMVSPSKLLTIWEKGFTFKYIEEEIVNGRTVHHINLFPKDPAKSKFHTVILKIDKETNEIKLVYIKGKDGTNMKYILTKFDENLSLPASTFVFDRAKHPEVECYAD
ncbi:LolA family protein [Crocinitomix catalasitica]|uniref:LolA family protein n=1 Tax=Crocinitomix catalasitica TaxID=184607 RepID=UPI00048433C7|nr:outer membrane lipoprotein carrier protein LolA [Crocinitomix catalasitica]